MSTRMNLPRPGRLRALILRTIFAAALGVGLFGRPSTSPADLLYGLRGPGADPQTPGVDNALLSIDTTTGQGTLIGQLRTNPADPSTKLDGAEDLILAPDGRLLAIAWRSGDAPGFRPAVLYEVDRTTAQATLIGYAGEKSPGVPYIAVEGLAFVGQTLYASADWDFDPFGDEAKGLITIDTTTGQGTFIGEFGTDQFGMAVANVEALATAPDGTLLGADIGTASGTLPRLLRIDPTTGAVTRLGLLPTDQLPAGMTFGPGGLLYASTIPARLGPITSLDSDLYTIDWTNFDTSDPNFVIGMTRIGPIGFDLVDGLTLTRPVPEPGTLALLGLGGLILAGSAARAHRRTRAWR
jgi:hypothetical protein